MSRTSRVSSSLPSDRLGCTKVSCALPACLATWAFLLTTVAPLLAAQGFHWEWRNWQELSASQSLEQAKVSEREMQIIAEAVEEQLLPEASDLGINSEQDLVKAALKTRVKLIDLNGDGVPELVAQGIADCSPTGNCSFWVFRKNGQSYGLILDGFGQTFTIQKTRTDGFNDIVVAGHSSAFDQELTDYRYQGGAYKEHGCYYATWRILQGGKELELKEPRVTPCPQ